MYIIIIVVVVVVVVIIIIIVIVIIILSQVVKIPVVKNKKIKAQVKPLRRTLCVFSLVRMRYSYRQQRHAGSKTKSCNSKLTGAG